MVEWSPQVIGLLPRDLAQVARSRSGKTLVFALDSPLERKYSTASARWLHLLVSGLASPLGSLGEFMVLGDSESTVAFGMLLRGRG